MSPGISAWEGRSGAAQIPQPIVYILQFCPIFCNFDHMSVPSVCDRVVSFLFFGRYELGCAWTKHMYLGFSW